MDAACLGFPDDGFDLVACIQNGMSAFNVDPRDLMAEALRVTRPGGLVLFSSYSPQFWPDRLEWFQLQADRGLLGMIDLSATSGGTIVCQDGFTSTTMGAEEFLLLASSLNAKARVIEVDASSLFCEIAVGERDDA